MRVEQADPLVMQPGGRTQVSVEGLYQTQRQFMASMDFVGPGIATDLTGYHSRLPEYEWLRVRIDGVDAAGSMSGSGATGKTAAVCRTPYKWTELQTFADGCIQDKPGGLKGGSGFLPAYELNDAEVPAGTEAFLRRGMGEFYEFQFSTAPKAVGSGSGLPGSGASNCVASTQLPIVSYDQNCQPTCYELSGVDSLGGQITLILCNVGCVQGSGGNITANQPCSGVCTWSWDGSAWHFIGSTCSQGCGCGAAPNFTPLEPVTVNIPCQSLSGNAGGGVGGGGIGGGGIGP